MSAVVLVIHLILAVAIIGLVLLQRSEGGGLGMGSSGGGIGGLASPQATANALTRATWICVGCFFVTSLTLGVIASHAGGNKSILERMNQPAAATTAPAEPAKEPETPPEPSAPISE